MFAKTKSKKSKKKKKKKKGKKRGSNKMECPHDRVDGIMLDVRGEFKIQILAFFKILSWEIVRCPRAASWWPAQGRRSFTQSRERRSFSQPG